MKVIFLKKCIRWKYRERFWKAGRCVEVGIIFGLSICILTSLLWNLDNSQSIASIWIILTRTHCTNRNYFYIDRLYYPEPLWFKSNLKFPCFYKKFSVTVIRSIIQWHTFHSVIQATTHIYFFIFNGAYFEWWKTFFILLELLYNSSFQLLAITKKSFLKACNYSCFIRTNHGR